MSSNLIVSSMEKSYWDIKEESLTKKKYFYGIFRSTRGKFSTFICKKKLKVDGYIVLCKEEFTLGFLAEDKANKMFEDFNPSDYNLPPLEKKVRKKIKYLAIQWL